MGSPRTRIRAPSWCPARRGAAGHAVTNPGRRRVNSQLVTAGSSKRKPPPKLSREEKKAATRVALLEAATKVFARHGYVAASVDEVAWEAGMTKGAVYSNFASKDALFAAVIERYHDRRVLELLDQVDPSAPASEQAALSGQQFMAISDPNLFVLTLEYTLHAARFPAGHEPMREGSRRLKAAVAEAMERMAGEAGFPFVLPVEELVVAFFAIMEGAALQQLNDPDGVPDDLCTNMLSIFVRGLQATAEGQAPSGATPTPAPRKRTRR
jgi:AcrR family transcriptional regulator